MDLTAFRDELFDLDSLDVDFTGIYVQDMVSPMLAEAFASGVNLTFGQPSGLVCVELFITYSELLGTVPEHQLQLALKAGAPAYWIQTLAYGNRANLLTPQQEQHEHEQSLSDLI